MNVNEDAAVKALDLIIKRSIARTIILNPDN